MNLLNKIVDKFFESNELEKYIIIMFAIVAPIGIICGTIYACNQ